MSTIVKSMVVGLGMLTVAAVAHAQSVANLPAQGPRASSENAVGGMAVATPAPSPTYVGPAPGAGTAPKTQAFQKPAGWDQDVSAHPYTSNMGPRPN